MVTVGNISTLDALEQVVLDRSGNFAIPSNELEVNTYRDHTQQKDIVSVGFRSPHKMKKYQGEIACNLDKSSNHRKIDIITIQIDDLLGSLERHWIEEGGSVTFYKNHSFFYRYVSDAEKACLELQCTACNHTEWVSHEVEMLDEYRDVFLMKMLPEAHKACDCATERFK